MEKFMEKFMLTFLSCCLLILGSAGSSMALDITSVSDNLYIESIDAIRIITTPKPTLRIVATFKNSTEKEIRIKNGYFNLFINPRKNVNSGEVINHLGGEHEVQPTKILALGQAKMGTGKKINSYFVSELDYFEISAGQTKPGILEIILPMDEPERNLLVNILINYIGLPGSFESISMVGKVTVGFGGKRGWAYQDLSLLELNYIPSMQKQVLFK